MGLRQGPPELLLAGTAIEAISFRPDLAIFLKSPPCKALWT